MIIRFPPLRSTKTRLFISHLDKYCSCPRFTDRNFCLLLCRTARRLATVPPSQRLRLNKSPFAHPSFHMPLHLRAKPNYNRPIVAAGETPADRCYFNLLHLREGETARVFVPGFETLFVVLSGRADITVGQQVFS